ncbi:hypothetical protein HGN32_22450 (plasmid) [Cereibacter sphaeroides]|uniref:hypothetical protein n=1 Tax=Cereibacter sphaeroides TaxID=1063 RepID=UPI0014526D79|nr:hypothetical protein [Cereibacter sphaeroides]QJC86803.1 hypothetical protein HGN32_22450 [Cereibacter sphaeroides]
MAHLAQTQLLRALIAAAVLSAGTASAGDELPDPAFAPGATGRIAAPVDRIVRDAERRGEALARELTIQPPREGVEIEDLAGIRTRALNDPRVRALLGAPMRRRSRPKPAPATARRARSSLPPSRCPTLRSGR